MSLYYLIASLPALEMERAPALAPDAFAALCREHLAPAEAERGNVARDAQRPPYPALRNAETLLRTRRPPALPPAAPTPPHQPRQRLRHPIERAV